MRHWHETWEDNHPHSDLTGAIIGAAIRVQKALGPGLLESAYKACLAHALHLEGLKAVREVRLDLTWEGLCLPGAYLLDLVVEDKVLVEAKTVDQFVDVHFAQVNSYLRFSGLEVGVLLNFHAWPLKAGGIRRVIRTGGSRGPGM